MSKPRERTIGVTAFKAKCLGLVEEVASGKTARVILTRRGRPVAQLVVPTTEPRPSTFGALKHLMKLDSSPDLMAPMGIELDAEKGTILNE